MPSPRIPPPVVGPRSITDRAYDARDQRTVERLKERQLDQQADAEARARALFGILWRKP